MKKVYKYFIILAVLFSFTLFSCGGGGNQGGGNPAGGGGGSPTGSSDIEITDPDFAFVKAEEYDPETFDVTKAPRWTDLDVDSEYYLFLSFDVKAQRDNDGQSLLDVEITFEALNILQGTMEDVATSRVQEMTFTDAQTGNIGKKTTISFKIPSSSAKPKTIKCIVSLKPVTTGKSHIYIGYNYDTKEGYHILGSDGYTKNLEIKEVQIQEPVLTVSELGSLVWKNVKNADYYCIFESGNQTPLTDFMGETIKIESDGIAVGGDMRYNIGEFLSGYHVLVIKAYSNNVNIKTSNYSNSIEHIW